MRSKSKMLVYHAKHGRHAIAASCMEITLYDSMSIYDGRHFYYWGLVNPATGHNWFCPLSGQDAFIRMACQLVNRGYTEHIGRMEQEYPSANFVQKIRFSLDDSPSDYELRMMRIHRR